MTKPALDRMLLELQAAGVRRVLDHTCEAGRGERRPAFADEDQGWRRTEPAQDGQWKTMGGTTIIRVPPHAVQVIGLGSSLRETGARGTTSHSRNDEVIDPEVDVSAKFNVRFIWVAYFRVVVAPQKKGFVVSRLPMGRHVPTADNRLSLTPM
jgi:hypothetical protein